MAHHDVKSWPEPFAAIRAGRPFDLRVNDRHYKVGDQITFNEFDDRLGKRTGEKEVRTITHMVEGTAGAMPPLQGVTRGYAILGLAVAKTYLDKARAEIDAGAR